MKPEDDQLACSFCGQARTAVRKLIAGPGVYICDGCVDITQRVLTGGAGAETPLTPIDAVPESEARRQCSFCGKRRQQVRALATADDAVAICSECLDLCDEILAEEFPKKT